MIGTSSSINLELRNKLKFFQESNRLVIHDGNWLSNEEINIFFKDSIIVWNAYDRSTQSGILPKAFMFSTPVLGNSRIPNEFLIDYFNGIYLKDNTDNLEIVDAISVIIKNFEIFSLNSRHTFINKFHYGNYKFDFNKIINNE